VFGIGLQDAVGIQVGEDPLPHQTDLARPRLPGGQYEVLLSGNSVGWGHRCWKALDRRSDHPRVLGRQHTVRLARGDPG